MILRTHYIFIAISVAIFGMAFILTNTAFAQGTEKVLIQFEGPVNANDKAFIHGLGGQISHEYSLVSAIAAEIPEKALAGLAHNPRVLTVEEDVEVQATALVLDNEDVATWSIANIKAKPVHDGGNTGVDVKVGIIDSGVSLSHPDLNVLGGKDFVDNDDIPDDVYGHGTHVAGTVCGSVNGVGVLGVAPDCDLYSLRVLNDAGSGYTSDILAAVEWAVTNNLDVINLSLGSSRDPGTTAHAVYDAAYDSGLLIVAAAGNSGRSNGKGTNTIYPANYSSVIAVAATDSTDDRAYFSSTGDNVEIAAPGHSVFSSWNNSTSHYDPQPECVTPVECYKLGSGTSMASPQVAGVAALIIAAGVADQNGDGNVNDEVRAILQSTATDLGSAGKDPLYGYGLVDASEAVASVVPSGPQAPVANAGADQSVSDANADGFEIISLDASASSDVDGFITLYEWDFDGDAITDDAGVTTTASFSVSGSPHTVTLTVTDNDGTTSSDNVNITVLPNQTPTANAGDDQVVEDTDGSGTESVTLDGRGSSDDGTIESYVWTENGIEIATGINPNAELELGLHTITLTVTDNTGTTNSDAVVIEVVPPVPQPDIVLSLSGTKDKGRHVVTLTWGGAISTNVDIYRDGGLLVNTENDGSYVDANGNRGGRTYTYQVCEEGSTTSCSVEQMISF